MNFLLFSILYLCLQMKPPLSSHNNIKQFQFLLQILKYLRDIFRVETLLSIGYSKAFKLTPLQPCFNVLNIIQIIDFKHTKYLI